MKTIFLSTAAIAAMLAPAVNAQSISFGGDVSASYIYRDYGGQFGGDRYQLNGSVVAGFGNFGMQFDLGAQSYAQGDGFNYSGYAAHAFYAINPALTVGAYFGVEGIDGSIYADYYGVEAKFTPGGADSRVEVEAFVGWFENRFSSFGANLIGLSGSYAITDNIDLFGGYLMGRWGNAGFRTQYDVLTAGAAYNFDSGIYVSAAYQAYVYPGASGDYGLQLQVGYQFGGGKVFGGRSYFALYPGD